MLAPSVAVKVIAETANFRVTGPLYEYQTSQAVTTLAQAAATSDKHCTDVLQSIVDALMLPQQGQAQQQQQQQQQERLVHLTVLLAMGADAVLESALPDEMRARKSAIVLSCAANTQRIFFAIIARALIAPANNHSGNAAASEALIRTQRLLRIVAFADAVAELLFDMVQAAEEQRQEQKSGAANRKATAIHAQSVFRLCLPTPMAVAACSSVCEALIRASSLTSAAATSKHVRLASSIAALRFVKLATAFVFFAAAPSATGAAADTLSALSQPIAALAVHAQAAASAVVQIVLTAGRSALGLSGCEHEDHLGEVALAALRLDLDDASGNASPIATASVLHRVVSTVLSSLEMQGEQQQPPLKAMLERWRDIARASASPSQLCSVVCDALALSLRAPDDAMLRASLAAADDGDEFGPLAEQVAAVLVTLIQRLAADSGKTNTSVLDVLFALLRCLCASAVLTVPHIEALLASLHLHLVGGGAPLRQLAQALAAAALFRPQLVVPVLFARCAPTSLPPLLKLTLSFVESALLRSSTLLEPESADVDDKKAAAALVERVCLEWNSTATMTAHLQCEGAPRFAAWIGLYLRTQPQPQAADARRVVGGWLLAQMSRGSSLKGLLSGTDAALDGELMVALADAAAGSGTSSPRRGATAESELVAAAAQQGELHPAAAPSSAAILTPGDIGKIVGAVAPAAAVGADVKQLVRSELRAWMDTCDDAAYMPAALAKEIELGVLREPGNPIIVAALSNSSNSYSYGDALRAAVESVAAPAFEAVFFPPSRSDAAMPSLHAVISPLVAFRVLGVPVAAASESRVGALVMRAIEARCGGDEGSNTFEEGDEAECDPFFGHSEARKLLAEVAARQVPFETIAKTVTRGLDAVDDVAALSVTRMIVIRFLLVLACEATMLCVSQHQRNQQERDTALWRIAQSVVRLALLVDGPSPSMSQRQPPESDDRTKLSHAAVESHVVSLVAAIATDNAATWWQLHASRTGIAARAIALALQRGMLVAIFARSLLWNGLTPPVLQALEQANVAVVPVQQPLFTALLFLCSACIVASADGTTFMPPRDHLVRVAALASSGVAAGSGAALKVIGALATRIGAGALVDTLGGDSVGAMRSAVHGFVATQRAGDGAAHDVRELAEQLAMLFDALE